MIRNSPKRSAKWCGSSASPGRSGERVEVALAPRAARRLAVLGEQRARLERDRERPEHVPERLRHPDRHHEQRRGDAVGAAIRRAAARASRRRPWRPASTSRVTARLSANTATVAGRRPARSRPRPRPRARSRPGTAAAARRVVGAVAVVEDGEADPGPPQREEQPERDPHAVHLRARRRSGARAARRPARRPGRGRARPTRPACPSPFHMRANPPRQPRARSAPRWAGRSPRAPSAAHGGVGEPVDAMVVELTRSPAGSA